jgi:hypothetical protein
VSDCCSTPSEQLYNGKIKLYFDDTIRRKILELHFDLSNFEMKYGNVQNVIVDEAQNFKDRDGDWYGLASHLVTRHNNNDNCYGYFWVFMDYSQKVHKFKAASEQLYNGKIKLYFDDTIMMSV